MHIYRMKKNEDIYDVAREYGVSANKISEDNELSQKGNFPVGRELLIIQPTRTYNVKSGDTLDFIARKFSVSKESLKRMNPELQGREKLYQGQLLTVKSDTGRYGMINTNGYFYRGCTLERLLRIIPYMGFVTICSAVYKNGLIHTLFRADEAISLIKSFGKTPLLRVYLTEIPQSDGLTDFINSITILAKGSGFSGITLSSLGKSGASQKQLDSLVLEVRRALMESDLILFAEGDLGSTKTYLEYADAGILTYDKLHEKDIPSFEKAENSLLREFGEYAEPSRTFLELSSFAYTSGKYIEKSEAIRITDRKRGELIHDDEKKITIARYGRSKNKEIICESLENTKAKLELISELGFMGVSFDIGRICISDLMMISNMFEIIENPIAYYSPVKCNRK